MNNTNPYRYKLPTAETGMNVRGPRNQLAQKETTTKNVGTWFEDAGKWLLNTLVSPIEGITQTNFYDPEMSHSGWQGFDDVFEGVHKGVGDALGYVYGGPMHAMVKEGGKKMMDAAGVEEDVARMSVQYGGKIQKAQDSFTTSNTMNFATQAQLDNYNNIMGQFTTDPRFMQAVYGNQGVPTTPAGGQTLMGSSGGVAVPQQPQTAPQQPSNIPTNAGTYGDPTKGQGWSDAVMEAASDPSQAIGNMIGGFANAGKNPVVAKDTGVYQEITNNTDSHPGSLAQSMGDIIAGVDPTEYAYTKKHEDNAMRMKNAKKTMRAVGNIGSGGIPTQYGGRLYQMGGVVDNPYMKSIAAQEHAKSQGGMENMAAKVGAAIQHAGGVVGESLSGMGMGGGGDMGGMMGGMMGGGDQGGMMGNIMGMFGGGEGGSGGGFMDMFKGFGGGSLGGGGGGGSFQHGGKILSYQTRGQVQPNQYDTNPYINREMPWKKTNAFDKTDFFTREEKIDMMNNPSTPRYISSGNPEIENKLSNALNPDGGVNMYNFIEYQNLGLGTPEYKAAVAELKERTDAMKDRTSRTFEKTKRSIPKKQTGDRIPKAQMGGGMMSPGLGMIQKLIGGGQGGGGMDMSSIKEYAQNISPEQWEAMQGMFKDGFTAEGLGNAIGGSAGEGIAGIVGGFMNKEYGGDIAEGEPTPKRKGKSPYISTYYYQNGDKVRMEDLGVRKATPADLKMIDEWLQNTKMIENPFKDSGIDSTYYDIMNNIDSLDTTPQVSDENFLTRPFENGGRLEKTSNLPMDMEGFTDLEPGFNRSNMIEINSGNSHSDLNNPHTPLNVPVTSFDQQGNAMTENVPILAEKGEFARKDPETGAVTIFSKNLGFAKPAEKLGKKEEKLLEKAKNPYDDISDATVQRALSNIKNQFIRLEEEQKVAKELKEEEDRMDLFELAKNGGRITKKNTYRKGGRVKKLSEYQKDLLGMDDSMPKAQYSLPPEDIYDRVDQLEAEEGNPFKKKRKTKAERQKERETRKKLRKLKKQQIKGESPLQTIEEERGVQPRKASDLAKQIADLPEEEEFGSLNLYPNTGVQKAKELLSKTKVLPQPPVEEPAGGEDVECPPCKDGTIPTKDKEGNCSPCPEEQGQQQRGDSGTNAINDYIRNLRNINADVENRFEPYPNFFEDYGRESESIARNAINDLPEWYMDRASQLASANVNSLENAIRNMGQSMGTSGYLAQMQAAKNKELAANQGYAAQAEAQREKQLGQLSALTAQNELYERTGAEKSFDLTQEARDAIDAAKYDTEKNILTARLAQEREANAARRNELLDAQMQWMYNNDRTRYDEEGEEVETNKEYGGKIKKNMYEYGSRVKRERQMKSDKAINEFRSFMRGFNKK